MNQNPSHASTAADQSAHKTEGAPPRSRHLTLAAMSLGYGVVQLDVTIVNTALDSIGTSLGGGVSELQWVVNTYTIAFAALILTSGALGDRIGAKRVFTAGFAIFTAASIGCAAAPSAAFLIAARAIQGIGAAILVPNSLALLNHTYASARERGRAVAIWAAGASLALTAGPLAGGALIALAGWRAIFLVNVPIGLVALWLAWRCTTETSASRRRSLDLPGQVAAVVALGALSGALIESGSLGLFHPYVLAGFAIFVAAAAFFIAQERRSPEPMMPLGLFAHPMFSAVALVGLFVNIAVYGLIFVFSLYLQQVNHLSAFATGLAFVPMLAAVLPFNLIAPAVAERIGGPFTIVLGAAMTMTGYLALLGVDRGTPFAAMALQFVAIGAGVGLLVPPMTSTLLGSVSKAHSGIAAGVLNAMRQTGSVLGVAAFGSLLASPAGFVSGLRLALMSSAILLAVAALVMIAARFKQRADDPAPA